MLRFTPWNAVAWLLVAAAGYTSAIEPTLQPPTDCCSFLQASWPSIVNSPSTAEYQARLARFYSLQQQELHPACTVKPASTEDVSRLVQIFDKRQCVFAVASGGHMSWKGSSNIDGGVLLDLSGLNRIEVAAKAGTASLGPGATWKEVYGAMAPLNVSATGARLNDVGVAGFLLGGGIAFASSERGFGADNVFNYEVVLANGTIVQASKSSNADLFWALKLAGSNYGIVTRFDIVTYPSPAIWGALIAYPLTNAIVDELLPQYNQYAHSPNGRNFAGVVFGQTDGNATATTVQVNLDAMPQLPWTTATPVLHLEKTASTHDVVDQVLAAVIELKVRTHWFSLTTKVDNDFFRDVYAKADQIFNALKISKGVSWSTSYQSFTKGFIEGAAGTPVYGTLKAAGDDLVCVEILTTWTDMHDDATITNAVDELGRWAEDEARRRGLLNGFIYLNYANGRQPVYERSVLPDDLIMLQEVRDRFDPSHTFQKLWKGGFKLPT